MLHITLEDGRAFALEPHRPPSQLKTGGDCCGNGSVEWSPDGLFLHEIAAQIAPEMTVVAAVRDDRYLPADTFIDSDCTLRLIDLHDAEGAQMLADTAKLVVNYAMFLLYPQHESLQSDSPLLYGYACTEEPNFDAEKVAQLNARIADILANPPKMTSYLMDQVQLAKRLAAQRQDSQAKYWMAQEVGDALRVYDMGNYIQRGDAKPLLPLQHLQHLHIASAEVLHAIGTPILLLNASVI